MSAAPYTIDDSYDEAAPGPPAPRQPLSPEYVTLKIERALLGAVLTVGLLPKSPPKPEDFLTEAHRTAWEAILAVAARGDAPEILPVAWELDKTGRLERAGGATYLGGHLDSTDCSDLAVYGRMVKEAALLRRMKRV